jgi:GNAT superfamily N-acetyltransferase
MFQPFHKPFLTKMSFSIQPLTYADFAARHRVGALTGAQDRQTQLKLLGDVHYLRDDPASAHRSFARQLQLPTHVLAKAADADGRFLGSLGVEFLGFAPEEVPRWDAALLGAPPALPTEAEAPPAPPADRAAAGPERRRAIEMVDRLEEMEDADWRKWRPVLEPPGSRSVVVTGFAVDPAHHRRGVGGALLAWAAGLADAAGVHMWVHSSEAGWRAYARAGFEVVGTLDVDLDEWAPGPPAEGGRWGHYVMRWMKRMPRAVEGEGAPKAAEG